MSGSNSLSEGIRGVDEFVCRAIPGKVVAGTIPADAKPSRVRNAGIAMQEGTPAPDDVDHLVAFRSRLGNLSAAQILPLVKQGGLGPEQLRVVQEVVTERMASHRAEVQQLNEILKTSPPA